MKAFKKLLVILMTVTMMLFGTSLDGFSALSYATDEQGVADAQEQEVEATLGDGQMDDDADSDAYNNTDSDAKADENIETNKDSDKDTDADDNAEQTLQAKNKASDESKWKITVSYDNDASIPEGAELEVREIAEDTSDYDKYLEKSAEQVGFAARDVTFARVFDISIVDAETGNHYQPKEDVEVSIQTNEDLEEVDETVSIVHFGKKTEVLENTVDEDEVQFETGSFSTFVVAAAPAPLGATGTRPSDVSELDDPNGFYISAQSLNANNSMYYYMNTTVTTGGVTYILRTAANDITDATVYYFDSSNAPAGQYRIYWKDGGDTKHYINHSSGKNLLFTTNENEATLFQAAYQWTAAQGGDSFKIKDAANGYYLNLKQIDTGVGFQATDAADSYMILTKAGTTGNVSSDPYGLGGKEFGIVYYSDSGSTGCALYTNGSTVSGKSVTVSKPNSVDIRITEASDGDVTRWAFEAISNGKYYIKANGKYLKLNNNTISLTSDSSQASTISVSPGTEGSNYTGKYRFTVINANAQQATALYYNGSNNFKTNSENKNVINSNEWLYLVNLIETGNYQINYVYEKTAEDTSNNRTPIDLPRNTSKTIAGDVAYTVEDPSQNSYTSQDTTLRYTYPFKEWTCTDGQGNTHTYSPGDSIPAADLATLADSNNTIQFKAVWDESNVVTTNRPVTVEYYLNQPTASNTEEVPGQEFSTIQTTGMDPDEVSANNALQFYSVQDVTCRYYKLKKTNVSGNTFPYIVYRFAGWQAEDNTTILQSNDVVDLRNGNYDSNHDNRVTLTAIWTDAYDSGTGKPYVKFSVWTDVSEADSTKDTDVLTTEHSDNTGYTPAIGGAIMYSYDDYGKEIWRSPSEGGNGGNNTGYYYTNQASSGHTQPDQGKYMLITHVDRTIMDADGDIRSLASSGGFKTEKEEPVNNLTSEEAYISTAHESYDVKWKLSELPSDADVMSALRELVRNGSTELKYEGTNVTIPESDLTTDNFSVRWCQAKYQSGNTDGWHVNAKLTQKTSYVEVTKTFAGNATAINQVKAKTGQDAFCIKLNDASDPSTVKKTLLLEDKTGSGSTLADRVRNCEIRSGSSEYGYVEMTDNNDGSVTYTWIVKCDRNEAFKVVEENYTLPSNTNYGVRAQYNQLNTGNSGSETMQDYTSSSDITMTACTSDETFSSVVSTNFYNTYIPEGVFVVNVVDDNGVAMPDVELKVYDSSGNQLTLYYNSDGEYDTVSSSGGTASASATTNAAGGVYLKLEQPQQGSGPIVYTIKETIPKGYAGYGSENTFKVSVDDRGRFTVPDGSGDRDIQTDNSLDTLESGNIVYGAELGNTSNKADIVLTKTWMAGSMHANSVELMLYQTTVDGGPTAVENAIVLNTGNNWTATIPDKPLMYKNSRIIYSIAETKIGNYGEGTTGYASWNQNLSPIVYKDGDGVISQGEPTGEIPDRIYTATEIDFSIENSKRLNTDITLNLINEDYDKSNIKLSGAEFWIYKELEDQSATSYGALINYGDQNIKTESPFIYTTDGSGEIVMTLQYNNTYYIQQRTAADGYDPLSRMIKIDINDRCEITMDDDQIVDDYTLLHNDSQNARLASLEVKNKASQPVAPTGFYEVILPYITLLLAGLFLSLMMYYRRRRLAADGIEIDTDYASENYETEAAPKERTEAEPAEYEAFDWTRITFK